MANSVCEVLLTDARLEAVSADIDGKAGAVVDFWGVVRRLEDGREIEGIAYEANAAMAQHQLRLVGASAAEKFQLTKVIVHHRIGFVPAGEGSLFVQVMARHREAAFEASKWIVDELKRKVPIWKRPKFKAENPRRAVQKAAATG
jgi:molybdopterin synthase catalytic subunit